MRNNWYDESQKIGEIKDAIIAEHDIILSEFDGNGQISKTKIKYLLKT